MTANDYLVGLHWHDVIVVGAGHNGLVAALLFAKKGLKVLVVEEQETLGGAVRTERPFARAPDLAVPTGATRIGLVPPELLVKLGIELPLLGHDPHTFVPTTGARSLTLGADPARNREQIARFSCDADARAHDAMHAELAALRDDLAHAWLCEPLSLEETAERYVRGELRGAFVDLCHKPVGEYIERWGFTSDLLKATYACAAFPGCHGTWTTRGTGLGLLVHHMGRLAGDGAWASVEGGMGTVTRAIADEAIRRGAVLETGAAVSSIVVEGGVARGVVLKDGTMHHATAVLCNADPFRMRAMLPREALPREYHERLDGYARDGFAIKVDLALDGLPDFTCAPGGAFHSPDFAPVVHLLPDEPDVLRAFVAGFEAAKRGELTEPARVELQVHTVRDPSLKDAEGRHAASLLAQWVPQQIAGATWEASAPGYVARLLAVCDRFAPGTSARVVDTFVLHPDRLASHFGLPRGNMHHVDNGFGFAERLPYATPVQGLYSCSAGTHPADAVVGAAGHNAALRLLRDMGKPLTAPPPGLSVRPPPPQ